MLKSDLIRIIEAELDMDGAPLSHAERMRISEKVLNTIFDEIIDHMATGGRVELRGFGVFEGRKRDARLGRNPRDGSPVEVPGKIQPFFKAGKTLRLSIDPGLKNLR